MAQKLMRPEAAEETKKQPRLELKPVPLLNVDQPTVVSKEASKKQALLVKELLKESSIENWELLESTNLSSWELAKQVLGVNRSTKLSKIRLPPLAEVPVVPFQKDSTFEVLYN